MFFASKKQRQMIENEKCETKKRENKEKKIMCGCFFYKEKREKGQSK